MTWPLYSKTTAFFSARLKCVCADRGWWVAGGRAGPSAWGPNNIVRTAPSASPTQRNVTAVGRSYSARVGTLCSIRPL